MLGNVRPVLKKLSDEDSARYESYYCGLCNSLGKRYGVISRMLLNYDMVFIAMIYDDLNGEDFATVNKGCVANPFKKKDILQQTKGTCLASDVLIILAYFKVLDNIHDEKLFKKIGFCLSLPYFYLKYKKAAKRNPDLASFISCQCALQNSLEKEASGIDSVSLPTAKMCGEIFRACVPANYENSFDIYEFGFFLGRVIYLLDALKDMQEDKSEGKFNIFNRLEYTNEEASEECFIALGEMAYWYKKAEFKSDKNILDNIIYLGLGRDIHFSAKREE